MIRGCLKCGVENHEATGSATESCPSCGAIYSKVAAQRVIDESRARRKPPPEQPQPASIAAAAPEPVPIQQASSSSSPAPAGSSWGVGKSILAVLGAAIAIQVLFPSRSTTTSEPATNEPAPAPSRETIMVSGAEMLDGYRANEVRQDAAMAGKDVLVSGSVRTVAKTFLGDMQVRLNVNDPRGEFVANLRKDQVGAAASLNKGYQAAVTCARVSFILGDAVGYDCHL